MYAFLFRRLLFGPKWLRFFEFLVLAGVVVFLLFQYGFPWVDNYFNLSDNTVG